MNERAWSRLSRAAWRALVVHLAAGLAMAFVLRYGLETNGDLADRRRFMVDRRAWWTAGWLCWTLAAVTILNFYACFAAAHRALAPVALRVAVWLTVAAVAADWTAQAIEVLVLPGLAGTTDATGFLAWHRTAVLLTGFLANGLYTFSALLLVWASRTAYPRWIQVAGCGLVAGGTALSAAAYFDSATGMVWANVALVPCLLIWLAGVAATAARRG